MNPVNRTAQKPSSLVPATSDNGNSSSTDAPALATRLERFAELPPELQTEIFMQVEPQCLPRYARDLTLVCKFGKTWADAVLGKASAFQLKSWQVSKVFYLRDRYLRESLQPGTANTVMRRLTVLYQIMRAGPTFELHHAGKELSAAFLASDFNEFPFQKLSIHFNYEYRSSEALNAISKFLKRHAGIATRPQVEINLLGGTHNDVSPLAQALQSYGNGSQMKLGIYVYSDAQLPCLNATLESGVVVDWKIQVDAMSSDVVRAVSQSLASGKVPRTLSLQLTAVPELTELIVSLGGACGLEALLLNIDTDQNTYLSGLPAAVQRMQTLKYLGVIVRGPYNSDALKEEMEKVRVRHPALKELHFG